MLSGTDDFFDKLIKEALVDQRILREMDPRDFEKFVRDLLKKHGFEVELTQATRDGGYDILARHPSLLSKNITLIDCKRYALDHKVGVGLVRELAGVVDNHDEYANGAIVTTSSFSGSARKFAEKKQMIRLIDHSHLAEWMIDLQVG